MPQISDIGIDLGTSQVLVYARGRGIVLREPAVVAADRTNGKVLAVGAEAYKLVGRTPGNVQAIRPFRQGTISDFEMAKELIHYAVRRVSGRHFLTRPRAIVSLPTGVSETEKRAVISVLFDAGMRKTQLLEKPLAAAIGIGIHFAEPYGSMMIDMGAGASDIAVLSSSDVVVGTCTQIGGDYFDDAIIRYLRKKHNLLIGDRTAEEVKMTLGSAVPPPNELTMDVTGRNLLSGLPRTQSITNLEVYEALKDVISDFIETIQQVLEHTPPQLASDIFEDGIILTGGASQLQGRSDAIYRELRIATGVADDPATAVVVGCGRALEDTPEMRSYLHENSRYRYL
ncbi:MAG: rod shape-determining protein [Clostridia bacterium]|nr:rod shape-determining protein [Clostridia bacterium]